MILDPGSKCKGGSKMMAGTGSSSSNKKRSRPRVLLLLLAALGAAALCVVVLQKMRERVVFSLLLQDRDRQILNLQLLLQRERESSKEMKRKLGDLKAKIISLQTQKMDLTNKLMETGAAAIALQEKQKELEVSLDAKQNKITMLMNKEAESLKANLELAALTELLKQKEAEIEEAKHHLTNSSAEDNIIVNGTISDNGQEDKVEKPRNSTEERTALEERNATNPVEMEGDQQIEIHRGGWVKFETNVDEEGLKHENQRTVDLKDKGSEKLESHQHGNEQEVVHAGLKGTEIKVGNSIQTKKRIKRQRVARKGREPEKHADRQFERSQIDQSQGVTGENEGNNATEGSKKATNGESEIQENSQLAEGLITEDGGGDKDPSPRIDPAVLPNEMKKEMGANYQDDDKNDREDKGKDSKLEMPEGSQAHGGLRTEKQSNSTVATETEAFPSEELEKNQKPEEQIKSRDLQLEKSKEPQDDESKNKSDGKEGDKGKQNDAETEGQDQGVVKETTAAGIIPNPEETGGHIITNDHQGKKTIAESDIGQNSNNENRELAQNAEETTSQSSV